MTSSGRARSRRGLLGALLAVGTSTGALAWATDGFRALTLDGARAAAVAAAPRPLPVVTWLDPTARVRWDDGLVTIVDFVSTSCEAICLAQGTRFASLQRTLRARGRRTPIRLLTIAFDPADDARRLDAWREARGVDGEWWDVARVAPDDRAMLLRTFGVTVVRDPAGGWRHNAAFHVVDGRGRLARIVPADDADQALRAADSLAVPAVLARAPEPPR